MRGEVWRVRLDGHGDLRLEVAVPMQQDQPKQGFALAAVEGAAVVGVEQRVNTHRNICGQEHKGFSACASKAATEPLGGR